jgi:hypothetical protein
MRQQPTRIKQVRYFLQAIGVSLLLITLIYLPFWSGPDTILSVLHEDSIYMASFATMLYDTSAMQISFEQGKLIGRLIFGFFYLYTLFLATKSLSAMLRGCFLTLFLLVAFATSKFEIWYAIWPVMLAVLVPRREQSLAALLLTYGASISVTLYVYIWVWLGVNDQTLAVIHDMAYLISFAPALLLLFGFALRRFSFAQYSSVKLHYVSDPRQPPDTPHTAPHLPLSLHGRDAMKIDKAVETTSTYNQLDLLDERGQ